MAAASLSLVACGSGSDSMKRIAANPVVDPDRTPDCNQMPRPAGCPEPEPVVPMPFAGLSIGAKALAYSAIQKAYFGIDSSPIGLHGEKDGTRVDKDALQITAWKDADADDTNFGRGMLTKVVKVTPSGSTGNIDYMFDLWTPGVLGGNSIYHANYPDIENIGTSSTQPLEVQKRIPGVAYKPLPGMDKIFSIGKGDYTTTNIDLVFDESYQYNVIKDYQVLSAEVDTDKDNTKDSTLHAELWTDYSSDTTSDYLVGGFWLLVPKDMSKDYSFGGFMRGDNSIKNDDMKTFTGKANYKGSLVGIHTSQEDDMPKISRLLGKVTIDVDFATTSKFGLIEGKAHDLKLDGTPVGGEILMNIDGDEEGKRGPKTSQRNLKVGNINGINYEGAAMAVFHNLNTEKMKPAAIVGTVGGRGGGNSFVATFGARKVEEEE